MTVYDYQLRRDQQGRIIEKTEIVADRPTTWTYAYDEAGRLTGAQHDGHTVCDIGYDREGRRSRDYFPHLDTSYRNFEYTMDDRLSLAGNNNYIHDENGFRSIWNNGGQYTLYQYAPDHRLLSAEWPETAKLTFDHDDQGRRAAKYRDGKLVEAYAWHDLVRMATFFDGKHEFGFTYREDERTPFAMRRDDGTVFGLFYDQIGSLRVVVDIHDNVIKEVQYDPFGGIISDSVPDFRVPLGFAGGLHDPDMGFVRFGWRDYDPFTGRWTAPDPLGDAGGDPDWYGYCLDDPVNGVDPLGLFFSAISARDYMEAASYLDGISWGGMGRSILDGPKNGNWGGKNHSGGVDGGEVGDAKPVDSADESYKRHDLNYEKIKNTPILGDVNKTQKNLKKQADKQLVNELKAIGDDPGKWDNPPTKQNENSSKLFRKGALFWF